MKFEMKKRILALALAGTTAFSVFGAAMSANAATVYWNGSNSSHETSGDSYYYQSYIPAGDITWSTGHIDATWAQVGQITWTVAQYPQAQITDGSAVYTTRANYNKMTNPAVQKYVTIIEDVDGLYFRDINDFARENGYTIYSPDANGHIEVGSETYTFAYNSSTGVYKVFDEQGWLTITNGSEKYAWAAVKNGNYYSYSSLNDGLVVNSGDGILNAYVADGRHHYFLSDGTGVTKATDLYEQAANTFSVPDTAAADLTNVTTKAGYTTLDATDVEDLDAILANPVSASGVVYLYDYADNLPVYADTFARAWANDKVVETMNDAGYDKTYIAPENGYGSTYSIRRDVIDEFEAFIEDLGIREYREDTDYLTAWAKDTIDNYAYQYYNDSVVTSIDYNHRTGELTINFGGFVNLYNFDTLVEDILNVATNGYTNVQTSELVYLMQQYDKYVDNGYVDQNPVETDDWGDLLVSLLEAPTEDEFRTSAAYRTYSKAAADYIDQYENAATSVAVKNAERQMYNFITNYQSQYRVSAKADTTNLAASLDNTYFNYNWNKSMKYDGKTYAAEVYAGSYDTTGTLDGNYVDSDYKGAWALYPAVDYSGTVGGANPGVTTTVSNVNDSYYWFYNVYTLAYNVYTDAQFTSVADLAASALDDAVAALTPTYNAYSSEILGAEEQNDKLVDLIETDYTASMWANKTKISDYITNRVSNDEIGHVGSQNAKTIGDKTATLMGWQKNQTVVSKSDINSVKTAKSNAEAALTALRNDEDNYNAAQATALQNAIDTCDHIISLYNGDYSKSQYTQSINGGYSATTGDKDQILKSDITDATQAVEDAINFSNIIMGWSQNEDGDWMYGTEEGYLNDGWHQVDGGKTWFYFNEDGTAKQSEWWQDGSTWYWFNSNCGAAVGWAKIDGDWYYFKGNNAMKTGWEKVEGSWYYMNSSGKMVTGWCQINGTWYYFSKESNALGQMLANTTTPDGYKVDANGALVE